MYNDEHKIPSFTSKLEIYSFLGFKPFLLLSVDGHGHLKKFNLGI